MEKDEQQQQRLFNLLLPETLAHAIWNKPVLLDKLLKAYAAHKFSAIKSRKSQRDYYYETVCINNVKISTERRLINNMIISFSAKLKEISPPPLLEEKYVIEKEYRRFINSSHPLIINKLNVSCNDFSDMKFLSREIEILFKNYRCCINLQNDTFTIQYKKKLYVNEVYLTKTLTREILFTSIEGPILIEPTFVVNKENKNEILGIASFLESSNIAIKTVYLEKGPTKLYQRICPDDYTKSYPFILEYEINDKNELEKDYFELGWRLNATLPKFNNNTTRLSKSSKPMHVLNQNDFYKENQKCLLKFDGISSTLQFYTHHFIIYNTTFSSSFNHTLPPKISYILKDYKFLVEYNLYTPSNKNNKLIKPNPLVIIDIQTRTLNAIERMKQIQRLRNNMASYLYDYYIFFQGEISGGDGIDNPAHDDDDHHTTLKDGAIYEVTLRDKFNIARIIRERSDKTKPNSSKVVDTISKLLLL